ncbi:TolC family protein [Pandoraea nosoerga]|uniref:Type I secretion outer membrane protein n=1 Tax=Pandoraea nosoerga TaxID=2508296 RepID=A0A5E4W589_9BURK|nr:TolC family protein [Pandoraea nosoerga]MBN4666325.1 TolC family protein [Pandoraea nosoerga]MBN4675996.1 TolC family protein [Pandoraea nosoerga]MBN4682091.1 TolC family protein [Pandoraea nosoerga]MBN4746480.1 TolC family protein [Pandoraea nosoerga]VVE19872.1 Type I secretion outer membrane protein [Pandoraea nosoerga]
MIRSTGLPRPLHHLHRLRRARHALVARAAATLPTAGAFAAAALVCGCSLTRATYERPALDIPAQYQATLDGAAAVAASRSVAGAPEAADIDPWWHAFRDPELDTLISQALAANPALAIKALQADRDALQAGLAGANRWPQFSASVTGSKSRALDGNRAPYNGQTQTVSGASVSITYEVDVWNKLAAQRDAAHWQAAASAWDRRAAALSLSSQVASLYWRVAYLNENVSSAQEDLRAAEHVVALVEAKRRAGAVSGIDPVQAHQDRDAVAGALANWERLRDAARHSLAVALGLPPQTRFAENVSLAQAYLPEVSPGLPASLLARRPDLAAAETRVRARLADVDAARLSFYPTFTLTGTAGTTSDSLSRLLANPVGTLAATIALPFLQVQTARFTTAIARNDYEQSVASFRNALLSALNEVEDALTARGATASQYASLARAATLAQRAAELSGARYRAGDIDLQSWLDAQRLARQARRNAAQSRLDQIDATLTLVKALGGTLGETFDSSP